MNRNLYNFYILINKHIRLTKSYSGLTVIPFIIKTCRLKPIEFILEGVNHHTTTLYRSWMDEYGNSLHLIKKKKLKLLFNDLSLDRERIPCTDLYFGIPLEKIIRISKKAFITIAKDEDLQEDLFVISLLGVDDFFRTYLYMYGQWNQISTLYIGIDNLKLIFKNQFIRNFIELKTKKHISIPCLSPKQLLTCVPVSDNFLTSLRQHSEMLYNLFKDHQTK